MAKLNVTGLNADVAKTIEPFFGELLTLLGDNLAAIYVTGVALGSDYIPKKSDVSSLLLVKKVNQSTLDALAVLGKKYGKKQISAPLIMTPEYLETSLDVYPMEFLELRSNHQLVYGSEFLADLKISKSNLRLQCEREFKDILINMQQSYIRSGTDVSLLNQLLEQALAGFLPIFRGLVHLKDEPVATTRMKIISQVADLYQAEVSPFLKILETHQSSGKLKLDAAKENFFQCYDSLGELISIVDELKT